MSQRREREGESARLSDDTAERLLARATQLDFARTSGASIAELRQAATEAGISPEAFDQALVELHGSGTAAAQELPKERRPSVVPIVLLVLLALAALLGMIVMARLVVPV